MELVRTPSVKPACVGTGICSSSVPSVMQARWPLWTVYPAAAGFFWCAYLWLVPALSRWLVPGSYAAFSDNNNRCWRQNICSLTHTTLATVFLTLALASDPGIFSERLSPHDNLILYLDISLSFGYFSFAFPISLYMVFYLKARPPYASWLMCLHHAMVVVAQFSFLLTQSPPFYMAASGLLFELTNVFYIPHVLMVQLRHRSRTAKLNSLALFVAYTLGRIVVCTALVPLSLADLAAFAPPDDGRWLAASVGLLCFYGLLLLSWFWYVHDILPALHAALQESLGATYYHACCPRCVRALVWRHCTEEGRGHAQQLRVIRELRMEAAAMAEQQEDKL